LLSDAPPPIPGETVHSWGRAYITPVPRAQLTCQTLPEIWCWWWWAACCGSLLPSPRYNRNYTI